MKASKTLTIGIVSVLSATALLAGCLSLGLGAGTSKQDASIESIAAELDGISPDKAKQTALDDAGVKKSKATFTKLEIGYDNGAFVYEIDFVSGGFEYDYEIDAKTGKVLEISKEKADTSESTTSAAAENAQGNISADKAKQAALKHAGVSESKATFTKARLDSEDGRTVYEVEFYSGDYEYDYEIDALTGAVISADKEREVSAVTKAPATTKAPAATQAPATTKAPATTQAPATTKAPATTQAPATTKVPATTQAPSTTKAPAVTQAPATTAAATNIGLSAAKQKALSHAGVSEGTARFIKAKLDGRKYDIEFVANGYEYDYEINALSGAVIEYEREAVETTAATAATTQASSYSYIGAQKAKKIAASHAGFATADVTFIKVSLDNDDGQSVYDVEFVNGDYEYEYEIDAQTGKVVDYDKERIDD